MTDKVQLFSNDLEAIFLRRPNRFLIMAENEGKEILCHCPNPGRLSELLFPGTTLILEKHDGGTGWTAAALKREEPLRTKNYGSGIVPLYASRANKAAEALILSRIIPGLSDIRREYKAGGSRFDFLCTGSGGKRHLVEVKACSLVEHGVAMFPDAPSLRALKHLEELDRLSREGYECHVLFVIMHGRPRSFIPNLHTDPAFAKALCRYVAGGGVQAHTALLRCGEDGWATLVEKEIPLRLDPSLESLAASGGGNYLIFLEIPEECAISVGSLGMITIKAGWYVYSGSARKNLYLRIARHQRKMRKQKHWHLDYLTPRARTIKSFPVLTSGNLECDLAADLHKLGGIGISGFGCSDCRCKSHLFFFPGPPLENRDFSDMLFRYRHVEFLKNA